MIFARKMPEFYVQIARIFFTNFRGHVPPCSPVSYAYGPYRVKLNYIDLSRCT